MKAVTNANEIITISSLVVAEMMEISHGKLLRMIDGYEPKEGSKGYGVVGVIPTLRKANIGISEFFIESSYKVKGNNKTYKSYEVTKEGCEVLANKLTGEKGILFTAKYVRKSRTLCI